MPSLILIIVDIFFLGSLVFNLYWQAQIVIKAKYKVFSAILTVIFAFWLLSVPSPSWAYIIMVSAFLTVTLMQGTGGLGKKKLVTSGFFSNVIAYDKITHVTLIPVELPSVKSQVVAVFTVNNRQSIQMTFKCSLADLQEQLSQVIPQSIEIEVTQL
ncbi:hypothetical protein [Bombilactobacillus thymidiniphilus]|uniref:Uncharacterized protein n=1 Tax=Bombilactobacillus thymidiniphilus TaxID=2923363 RepID=A0ABY4PF55_9LACO|nr:hypothetical protein [Bombilactobacillus thymidiniphilus]UQS84166.1 hypothetical protein MOO47_03170 [Bombilactobacillus thymidiniphilus]